MKEDSHTHSQMDQTNLSCDCLKMVLSLYQNNVQDQFILIKKRYTFRLKRKTENFRMTTNFHGYSQGCFLQCHQYLP